jgi:hypothetical protein
LLLASKPSVRLPNIGGEHGRFARTEANLFTILQRLREFQGWNDTPMVAKACSILELSLEIGRREVTSDMEIWRAWLMASSISIVARLAMLDEHPQAVVDALFEEGFMDVLFGRRALVEPPRPGDRIQ